jgi:alpha-beta hydrolase superfamily lysophospholipase
MSYRIEKKEIPSSDGIHTLHGKVYVPEGRIRGVFQIVHGMAEHIGRYDKFMAFMAESGFVVCGHDHVGHGKTCKAVSDLGFIAENGGHNILIKDTYLFANAVKEDFPEAKHILMGHSMGSFIARHYAARYGKTLDGLILMGTGGPNSIAKIGIKLCASVKKIRGGRYVSQKIDRLAFGSYNSRTSKESKFDWLSLSRDNIEKYLDDELCGFPFTVSAMQDLISLTYFCNTSAWARAIPKELPIYLVSGSEDPVGEYGSGVRRVGFMLHKAGVKHTKITLYTGFRHEILNERCAEKVSNDILSFSQKAIFMAKEKAIKEKSEAIKNEIAKIIMDTAVMESFLGDDFSASQYPTANKYYLADGSFGEKKAAGETNDLMTEFLKINFDLKSCHDKHRMKMTVIEDGLRHLKESFKCLKDNIEAEQALISDDEELWIFTNELSQIYAMEDILGVTESDENIVYNEA